MPRINDYKCNKCDLKLPTGWGYSFYVEDDKGNRIVCPHPAEASTVEKVLGKKPSPELVQERTGFNSYCVCLDCLHQFKADLGIFSRYHTEYLAINWEQNKEVYRWEARDKRECPKCKSKNVKRVLEMVGQACPKCKEGVIEEIYTHMVS